MLTSVSGSVCDPDNIVSQCQEKTGHDLFTLALQPSF